ncbi:hypothetical protein SVAN01_03184 [Stagonosporopsis vannaccii]|nr:hypothetical protein SVAN01_03184 [Stagonosporopsis vannaccii]
MSEATRSSACSAGPRPCIQHNEDPDQETAWLLAIPDRSQVKLYIIQIKRWESGATIMKSIKKEYEAIEPGRRWFPTSIELEDAIISSMCIGDSEAQDYPRGVIIEAQTPRSDLTTAFENPLLLCGKGFALMNEQFTLPAGGATSDRKLHAILIKKATCKMKVAIALIVMVLFSIIIGLVAGFLTGDTKIGLAVCAGAVGIFALVQTSLDCIETLKARASR